MLVKCCRCEKEQPREEYYPDKRKKSGLQSACRTCQLAQQKNSKARKRWRKENAATIAERSKKWQDDNRDKRRASWRKFAIKKHYEKYHTDIEYKLGKCVSAMVRAALKNKGGLPTFDYLPYTREQLKEHLEKQFEPWMTWENHGKWHIHHIIPQSHLLYDSMTHPNFLKCWALENLMPLEAKENCRIKDNV